MLAAVASTTAHGSTTQPGALPTARAGVNDDSRRRVPASTGTLAFAEALACAKRQRSVIAVAHRGRADRSRPENSASGLRAAMRAGAGAMEIDLKVTADGVLVLHHDERLERTTTASGRPGDTTWEDLSQAFLRHDDGRVADERPLRLSEAFAVVPEHLYWLLDIKDASATTAVLRATIDAGRHRHAAFIAYSIDQAETIRAFDPGALVALGTGTRKRLSRIRERGILAPVVGLLGNVATAEKALLRLAGARGFFLLGSTYLGDPSIEEVLAGAAGSGVLAQIRPAFTLWVTNNLGVLAPYLAAIGRSFDRTGCAAGRGA